MHIHRAHMHMPGWKMRLIILFAVLSVMLFACSTANNTNLGAVKNSTAPVQQEVKTTTTAPSAAPKIACGSDSDCGERTAKNAYCFEGNAVGDLYEWQCENPGTADAKCVQVHKKGVIAECKDDYFCRDGECIQYASCNDTDGGMNFTAKGKVTTNDNAIYEDNCIDATTLIEYYCSSDNRMMSFKKQDCICKNDQCTEG